MGDERVFGLTAPMADHTCVARLLGLLHRVKSLRDRADLVDLDQDRVRGPFCDPATQDVDVRNEQVIADQLGALAHFGGDGNPSAPIVLTHAVFYGHEGVSRPKVTQIDDHLLRRQITSLEHISPLAVDLSGCNVEREPKLSPIA